MENTSIYVVIEWYSFDQSWIIMANIQVDPCVCHDIPHQIEGVLNNLANVDKVCISTRFYVCSPTHYLCLLRFSGTVPPTVVTTPSPSSGGVGCQGGVRRYPSNLPNSHYYTQLCTTSRGLRIVSRGLASARALERTAYLLGQVTTIYNINLALTSTYSCF